MEEKKEMVNPDETRYDVDNTGTLSTKASWFEEHANEFDKTAEYIKEHDLLDHTLMTHLVESGLSVIIHQIPIKHKPGSNYTYCMSLARHGKHIETENVERGVVIKLLESFLEGLKEGSGYFYGEGNEKEESEQ